MYTTVGDRQGWSQKEVWELQGAHEQELALEAKLGLDPGTPVQDVRTQPPHQACSHTTTAVSAETVAIIRNTWRVHNATLCSEACSAIPLLSF